VYGSVLANADRTDLDSRAPFILLPPPHPSEFSLRASENVITALYKCVNIAARFFIRRNRVYCRLALVRTILSGTYESLDDKIKEPSDYSRYSHCSPSCTISLRGHSREIITRSFALPRRIRTFLLAVDHHDSVSSRLLLVV